MDHAAWAQTFVEISDGSVWYFPKDRYEDRVLLDRTESLEKDRGSDRKIP